MDSKAFEDYAAQHMTRPSPLCEELAAYTREHVEMSVMLCGPLVAGFLGAMCRILKAKRVLEIGCYTGYSALAMAEQLPGDGKITTLDVDSETTQIGKIFWDKSPHGKKIELIMGDAKRSLEDLSGPWDFVFIDADKGGYVHYLEKVLPQLKDSGVVVADNCFYSGQVLNLETAEPGGLAIHRFNRFVAENPNLRSVFLPIRDGLQVINKA